jgi:hypothetical protein
MKNLTLENNTTCSNCTIGKVTNKYYTMMVKDCVTYFHTVVLKKPFGKSYRIFLKNHYYHFETYSIAFKNNSLVQYRSCKVYKMVSKLLN